MIESSHVPVLLEEVMYYLGIKREGIYVDCTIGLGGHSLEILKRNPHAKVIGLDVDEMSLLKARDVLSPFTERVELYHSDFRHLSDLQIDFSSVSGLLLDLGISSFQLDTPERGFSFNQEGPLDMRMDLRKKFTAAKIIEKYSEHKLADVFHRHGELRQARRLAREIASRRKVKKIQGTTELRKLVEEVCRWRPQKGKIHPAAKVFQALRIEVNQELDGLADFIEKITRIISRGARILVISFHSLEDRIIKRSFAHLASAGNSRALLRILTKKPVIPSEEEIHMNSRARSAKMRAAERI
jgi:16S rRNA (cytosine1402-N4)-methyltransferase